MKTIESNQVPIAADPVTAQAEATDLLRECYAEILRRPLVPGHLTEREEEAVARAEAELASEAFVQERTEQPWRSLKIADDTYVRECLRRTVSGPLRLTVRLRGELIDALAVSPARWRPLARAVEGTRLDRRELLGQVDGVHGGVEMIDALLAMNGKGRSG